MRNEETTYNVQMLPGRCRRRTVGARPMPAGSQYPPQSRHKDTHLGRSLALAPAEHPRVRRLRRIRNRVSARERLRSRVRVH